jgi:hypothetical protein
MAGEEEQVQGAGEDFFVAGFGGRTCCCSGVFVERVASYQFEAFVVFSESC